MMHNQTSKRMTNAELQGMAQTHQSQAKLLADLVETVERMEKAMITLQRALLDKRAGDDRSPLETIMEIVRDVELGREFKKRLLFWARLGSVLTACIAGCITVWNAISSGMPK